MKAVWEGCDDGDDLVVMLSADGGGDGDKELKRKLEELTAAGNWFKVRAVHGVALKPILRKKQIKLKMDDAQLFSVCMYSCACAFCVRVRFFP